MKNIKNKYFKFFIKIPFIFFEFFKFILKISFNFRFKDNNNLMFKSKNIQIQYINNDIVQENISTIQEFLKSNSNEKKYRFTEYPTTKLCLNTFSKNSYETEYYRPREI